MVSELLREDLNEAEQDSLCRREGYPKPERAEWP
jgi:hypothetical protein